MPCAIVFHICATQIQSLVRGYFTRRFLRVLQPQWPRRACNPLDSITQEPFPSMWTMHVCENGQLFQFSIATLMCQFPYQFQTNPFTRTAMAVENIKSRIHRLTQLRHLPVLIPMATLVDWPYMQVQAQQDPVLSKKRKRLLFPSRRRSCIR